jgi:hypothetical protein
MKKETSVPEKAVAEQFNYWDTTVHPAKSQAEIVELLENFGATNYQLLQGQAGGRFAWMVRFEWQGKTYRFVFTPLECRYPHNERSFSGKRRTHNEQAKWQMGRVAAHFVKAILTAAAVQPEALFGYLELPGVATHPSGLPMTAAEINVEGLTQALPDVIDADVLYLTDGTEERIQQ